MNQKHYNELMKIAADLETEGDGAIAKSLRAAIATPTPLADAAAMAEREALRSLLSEAFDAGWDRSDECDNAYNNGTSEQLMVPPQAQEPEVFQKWRAEYFSDRNEVVSALLARAEGEFKWPPLPALPEKSWNVAGHAYFTEHQMQGYANAYGEAVRAALATTEATDAVRFFWQQHTLSDTSAMSMAELHNDTECVIRGHRAATMTDAIAPTEGAVPVDLITALSIARQFVPNGTEAAERVDAAMGAALSAPSPEAPAVDALTTGAVAQVSFPYSINAPVMSWLNGYWPEPGALLYAHPASEPKSALFVDNTLVERLFIKHGGPVDGEGWCINKSGLYDFLHEYIRATNRANAPSGEQS